MESLNELKNIDLGAFMGRFGGSPINQKMAKLCTEHKIEFALQLITKLSELNDGYESELERFGDLYKKILDIQNILQQYKNKLELE